jgi:hypothetical protein
MPEQLGKAARTLRGALVFLWLVVDCLLAHSLRRAGLTRSPHAPDPGTRA